MQVPGPEHRRVSVGLLKTALQRLAMTPEEQIRQFPGSHTVADELALEFSDALAVCTGNGYLDGHATSQEFSGIDMALERMSGADQAERWTRDALETDIGWRDVRKMANDALRTAGWLDDPPPEPGA